MKNIIDLTMELINQNGAVTTEDIIAKVDNEALLSLSKAELITTIYNDLQIDGRFINLDEKWDLKLNYTMKDIMKEQYRNIGVMNIVEEEEELTGLNFEDEPELQITSHDDEDESVTIDADMLDEFEEI